MTSCLWTYLSNGWFCNEKKVDFTCRRILVIFFICLKRKTRLCISLLTLVRLWLYCNIIKSILRYWWIFGNTFHAHYKDSIYILSRVSRNFFCCLVFSLRVLGVYFGMRDVFCKIRKKYCWSRINEREAILISKDQSNVTTHKIYLQSRSCISNFGIIPIIIINMITSQLLTNEIKKSETFTLEIQCY